MRMLAALILLIASGCPAIAHDWYPSICCNGTDCHRWSWNDVQIIDYGHVRVRINDTWLDVGVSQIRSEPSPDGYVHICYGHTWQLVATRVKPEVRCVFLPATL